MSTRSGGSGPAPARPPTPGSGVADILEAIRTNRHRLSTLGCRIRFDLNGAGSILVDATTPDVRVSEAGTDEPADTMIRLSPDTMRKLLDGRLNAIWAYTTGELKVAGSQAVARKLGALLKGG